MPSLIVNADDFGLTSGVNRAVLELHQAGALSSATLMARANATSEAAEMTLQTPSLGVGCHVVLVDGEPILPPEKIPSLVDQRTGCFYPTLGTFLQRLLTGRIHFEDIEAEAGAQIASLQEQGVQLTHIDTHKHSHMFPAVLRPVLRAAKELGIRKIRNPFEPTWSRNATIGAPFIRRMEIHLLGNLRSAFFKAVRDAEFATPDGSIGVLATGTLNRTTVSSLLRAIPAGTYELVAHPGYNDEMLAHVRTRLRATREIERDALLSVCEATGLQHISFADLRTT